MQNEREPLPDGYFEDPEDVRQDHTELIPDRVLPFSKDKYLQVESARAKFKAIQRKHGYILIEETEDARNWVFKVLDPIK